MKKLWAGKILSIIALLLMPLLVFASDGSDELVVVALIMETFTSIFMSVLILKPLSETLSKDNSKKIFWILFVIRAVILIFCDFFVTPSVAIVDLIGACGVGCIIAPICTAITKIQIDRRSNQVISSNSKIPTPTSQDQVKGIELKCAKCNTVLQITDKACPSCGELFAGNNVVVSENADKFVRIPQKVRMLPTNFDKIYSLTENKMVEEFIKRELAKAGIDKPSKLIPSNILKRKKLMNIIFSALVFAYITLIFFHFPMTTYLIGFVILLIYFIITKKYNFVKYLKREIKLRPSQKISNIIMSNKDMLVEDNSFFLQIITFVIAVVLPMIIFTNPRIMYEKVEGGYAVRFYTMGLTNMKNAVIPEEYKGEKVVSLRGNTFSNMWLLEKVTLPDSITEIRGQAFKNCKNLKTVNIPKNLEYLGGGAFYNAKSIKRIELPNTLTYLGGESFYGAKSLEYVKLSNNLSEIRGSSFEYCTSLKSITIPDSVTRIGGHAFYGDLSLSEVFISEGSRLDEIGSSAFRKCLKLYNITIPSDTYVNERAFKESPTYVNRYVATYNHYKPVIEKESEISINQTVNFMLLRIKVSLISLNDTRTNKSTDLNFDYENVVGRLKIVTADNEYYYDFDLGNGKDYYVFEGNAIKISPGIIKDGNYTNYVFVSLSSI